MFEVKAKVSICVYLTGVLLRVLPHLDGATSWCSSLSLILLYLLLSPAFPLSQV